MDHAINSGLEPGAVAHLWRTTCSRISSTYGRLVFLASLRDQDTGHYNHEGLTQSFGEAEADRALRHVHKETFSEWLCFDLEQQKADLDLYLSSFAPRKRRTVDIWDQLKPYRGLVPASATAPALMNFETNFQILVQLLKAAHGAS